MRTDTIYGLCGAINSPLVNQAIISHGNQIDPMVVQAGVTVFINGINSLTQGLIFSRVRRVQYPPEHGTVRDQYVHLNTGAAQLVNTGSNITATI